MRKVSIFNSDIKDNPAKRLEIEEKLKRNGYITTREGELLIVIGGDGTFLSAVRKRMNYDPVYVGFNNGNLGYFSEFTLDDFDKFLRILEKKEYTIEEVPVYEVRYKDEMKLKTDYFINDFVVEKASRHALHMGIDVDDGKTNENLGSYSVDGVVISTNLGSTAYNMNTGGAIVMAKTDLLQIVSIAPINNKCFKTIKNGVIVDSESELTIYPNKKTRRSFRMVCDGREIKAKNTKFIEVKKSKKTIKILRSKKYSKIEQMKDKIMDF